MAIGSYPSPPSETTLSVSSATSVRICLKDGHDTDGAGMICDMSRYDTFKNIFGHFKARSCKSCRAPDEMRFKKDAACNSSADLVSADDTPSKVCSSTDFRQLENSLMNTQLRMYSDDIYVIRVWSNVPGLQCADCKRTGYLKTNGVDATLSINTPPICTNSGTSETITLLVKDQTGFEMSVKMLNTTPFEYLMDMYSARALRDRMYCRFLIDGEKLVARETPKKVPHLTLRTRAKQSC